jgi:hypothetical protein
MTDREKLGRELAAVLDRIESEEAALRELVKARRERIAGQRERARELRDLIAGRTGAQSVILETLEEAGEVADRKGRK